MTQQKNNKKKEFDIDLDYNSDFIKIDDISLNETDVRIQIDDIFYEWIWCNSWNIQNCKNVFFNQLAHYL